MFISGLSVLSGSSPILAGIQPLARGGRGFLLSSRRHCACPFSVSPCVVAVCTGLVVCGVYVVGSAHVSLWLCGACHRRFAVNRALSLSISGNDLTQTAQDGSINHVGRGNTHYEENTNDHLHHMVRSRPARNHRPN